ncbi:MAG: hypothetical protein JWM78_2252 [Verrucomicrobiaceae bacterium]|nr:hypothetical protein [Verrucomicrobiaceae bacterium]
MPHLDDDSLPEIPELIPDSDDLESYKRQNQSKPKTKERVIDAEEDRIATSVNESKKGGSPVWAILAGIIALAAVGWAGYLQTQLLAAEQRVGALEQRLSSTDESVNQSNVSLQVKIKEIDESLTQVRDETLKRYKTLLDQHGSQIDTLDKAVKAGQAGVLAKMDQRIADETKLIETERARIDKLPPLIEASKKKLDEHQLALDTLSNKVKAVGDSQVKLDGRLSNNEEWVESINVFRKQMNREIVNIKQQIVGGKPAPVPAENLQ